MDYPIIIKDILPQSVFFSLYEEIEHDWSFINQSSYDAPIFWAKQYNSDLTSLYSSSIVKLKIQKFLKRKLNLIRIQHNAQTSFQESLFHKDIEEDLVWTLVLFTSPYWNTNWGGEFVLLNQNKNNFDYVRYFPNTGVLFPSNWDHKGKSPEVSNCGLRTTIGFTFCDSKIYENLIQKYPEFGIYS